MGLGLGAGGPSLLWVDGAARPGEPSGVSLASPRLHCRLRSAIGLSSLAMFVYGGLGNEVLGCSVFYVLGALELRWVHLGAAVVKLLVWALMMDAGWTVMCDTC